MFKLQVQMRQSLLIKGAYFTTKGLRPAAFVGAMEPGGMYTIQTAGVMTEFAPNMVKSMNSFKSGFVSYCAEANAANELMLFNSSLKMNNITFTPALRVRNYGLIYKEACPSCVGMKMGFK